MTKRYYTTNKKGEEVEVDREFALELINAGKKTIKDFDIETDTSDEDEEVTKLPEIIEADEDSLNLSSSSDIRKPVIIAGETIEGDVQPDIESEKYAKALAEFKSVAHKNYKNDLANDKSDIPYMMPRVDYANYLQEQLDSEGKYIAADGNSYDFSNEDVSGLVPFQGAMDIASVPGRAIAAGLDAAFTDEDYAKSMANVDASDPLYSYTTDEEDNKVAVADTEKRNWLSYLTQDILRDPATPIMALAGGPLVNVTKGAGTKLASKAPKLLKSVAKHTPLAAAESGLYEGISAADDYGAGTQVNRGLENEDITDRLLNFAMGTASGGVGDALLGKIATGLRGSGTNAFLKDIGAPPKVRKDAKFTDDLTDYLTNNYTASDLSDIQSGIGEGRNKMVSEYSRDFAGDLTPVGASKGARNYQQAFTPGTLSAELGQSLDKLIRGNKLVDKKSADKVFKKFNDLLDFQQKRVRDYGGKLTGEDLLQLRTSIRDNMKQARANQKLTKAAELSDKAIYDTITDVLDKSVKEGAGEGLTDSRIYDKLFANTLPISNVTNLDAPNLSMKPSSLALGNIGADLFTGNLGGAAGVIRDAAAGGGAKRRFIADAITPKGIKTTVPGLDVRKQFARPGNESGPLKWLTMYDNAGLENVDLYDPELAKNLLPSNTSEYFNFTNPANLERPFKAAGTIARLNSANALFDNMMNMIDNEDNK